MKLYHVSYRDLGAAVKLVPRSPVNRAPGEPEKPPRVCVSTRIGDCIRLMAWADGQHKCHVYVTEVKQLPRASWSLPKRYVPDYKKYGREEVWLLGKAGYEFQRFGYVRFFRLELVTGRQFWYFKRGGSGYAEWTTDPTRLDHPYIISRVRGEVNRHLEMRRFIRETREKHELRPKVARYVDDIVHAEQIKRGETPHRVPLSKF